MQCEFILYKNVCILRESNLHSTYEKCSKIFV